MRLLASLALLLACNLTVALTPFGLLRLGVSLGQTPLDDVMSRWVSHWGALRVVNRDLPVDARIVAATTSGIASVNRQAPA